MDIIKKYFLVVLLICQSHFASANIIGLVYDSCVSPKRAQQPITLNWVYGLEDRNKPTRINQNYSNDGCLAKLKTLIQDTSNVVIGVDMFSFRSYVLANELVTARQQRNVNVAVIVDRAQNDLQKEFAEENGFPSIQETSIGAEIPMFIASGRAGGISHNKTLFVVQRIIVDNQTKYRYIFVTGSYNYSDNAETMNRENLVFISSPVLALEQIYDMYTEFTDEGDTQIGARQVLGQSSSSAPTQALPDSMNSLFQQNANVRDIMLISLALLLIYLLTLFLLASKLPRKIK